MFIPTFSFRFCIGCLTYGRWVCTECKNRFIQQPPACYLCRGVNRGSNTHLRCIETGNEYLSSLFVAYEYNRITRRYLKYIKFKSSFRILDEIVHMIIPKYIEHLDINKMTSLNSSFVPIPLHRNRFNERGYNQSEIIASILSKEIGIPVLNDILYRSVDNKSQTKVTFGDRRSNIKGNFDIYNNIKRDISQNIILVDDVITTGSTIEECSKVIRTTYPYNQIHGFGLFRPKPKFTVNKFVPHSNRDIIKA